jgi:thiol:disulfide interchange protein
LILASCGRGDLEHFDDAIAELVPGKERSVRPSERHPGNGRLRPQLRQEHDFALPASRGSNTFRPAACAPPIIDDRASVVTDCSSSPTAARCFHPAALIAGLVSFLSPCVLPLVPPYLIYLTGATIEHVANDEATRPRSAR